MDRKSTGSCEDTAMKLVRNAIIAFALVTMGSCVSMVRQTEKPIVLETESFRYVLGRGGQNLHFMDKRDGVDYCNPTQASAFARIAIDGRNKTSNSISESENGLQIGFADVETRISVRYTIHQNSIVFRVEKVEGPIVDELELIGLTLVSGTESPDPFTACVLALNLQTNVPEIPQANTRLRALCYSRFGLEGAEAALLACPQSQLRPTMQQTVARTPALPHSSIGGPWALDADINRGSYLFNFGGLSIGTVDRWIELAEQLGIDQIDFHGGSSFRFGDCFPNPETYPDGKASFKAVIDRLHEAGIAAGLHTYAFFIDKKCPWVTPVPDPRLAKDAAFTLAADLTKEATYVPVVESTKNMSTITGFFVRNSVTLQIDDELIIYRNLDKDAPFAFTDCERGAYGTTAAPHAASAKVYHLKECFGLFVPDPETTLLAEVARKNAEMFNECGFDMMYLDALDGEDILGGGENGWHYGSQFVFELVSRHQKPALMEMSTFHHHLWYVRSRMGAWDHPTRGHKRFIDIHCAANLDVEKSFLPAHLGWWAIKTWSDIQGEPTFADDIEYLCGKALGHHVGISIMGINPDNKDKPVYQRLAKIIRNYERLRRSRYFNDEIREQLRVPGKEFTLVQTNDSRWEFLPTVYVKQKIEGNGQGDEWHVTNPYSTQPLKLRLETLMSSASYSATDAIELISGKDTKVLSEMTSAEGVQLKIESGDAPGRAGQPTLRWMAANSGQNDPKAAWAKVAVAFPTPIDLSQNQVLGVWIYGDGKGEVLNFQLSSPEHLVSGLGERYVVVDFEGWKYIELVEMESERYNDYRWPYGNIYSIFRERVNFQYVDQLSIWCNNIPLNGSICCWLGPIRALPQRNLSLQNPSIAIGTAEIVFPVTLETGQYLEFNSMSDCKHYGKDGELIQDVKPLGVHPVLMPGDNLLHFQADNPDEISTRARITIISHGDPL